MKENLLFLILSVSLSAGRNIASKKTAGVSSQKSHFFLSQSILFGCAALLLFPFGIQDLFVGSASTLMYGLIYGILLILSQWMFTLSLKSGNTSVCSVVYSLGFLLPTISGTLFWNETLTLSHGVGILIAVIIILLTAHKSETEQGKQSKAFLFCILTAMVSSGGLGIMQKIQQSSETANEKGCFLLIAFFLAFSCSLFAFLLSRDRAVLCGKKALYPALTGLCFGGANLCNTILAGKMKSAAFFPLQNIATILLSTLLGIALFKEKPTLKTITILILGITVIFLF